MDLALLPDLVRQKATALGAVGQTWLDNLPDQVRDLYRALAENLRKPEAATIALSQAAFTALTLLLAAFLTSPGWRPEFFQQGLASLSDGLAKLDVNPMSLFAYRPLRDGNNGGMWMNGCQRSGRSGLEDADAAQARPGALLP
ncbi:MAG: hypothetical protein HC933_12765 [Pleurocapsa sp. SU_196_0]|nr:hypothetical protein [Pleurocapsa sp. SU_196_0]